MSSESNRIGIDLSKFVICGVNAAEQRCLKRTLKREEVLSLLAQLPNCLVAMEAGSGAHYWARELVKLGHNAKIIDPKLVVPYRRQGRTGKNDANDAEAIWDAAGKPAMRFVPIKDEEQQAILVVRRVRKGLVNDQNRKSNRLRGLMAEFGVVVPKGIAHLKSRWPDVRQAYEEIVPTMAWVELDALFAKLSDLHKEILNYDRKIRPHVRPAARASKLAQINGTGPITASAIVATVGNGRDFKNGRQFCDWLGLKPRQYSPGGKTTLGSISKSGNAYLRTLLIHGARSELRLVHKRVDAKSQWALNLRERRTWNQVAVALAHKHACICGLFSLKKSLHSPHSLS